MYENMKSSIRTVDILSGVGNKKISAFAFCFHFNKFENYVAIHFINTKSCIVMK